MIFKINHILFIIFQRADITYTWNGWDTSQRHCCKYLCASLDFHRYWDMLGRMHSKTVKQEIVEFAGLWIHILNSVYAIMYTMILPRQQWSLLNRFHCGACRRKWRLSDTDLCPCGETQTMSHIVESCPVTKLNGGLSRLHSADEDAVSWLTNYGKWHAYEKKKKQRVNWCKALQSRN